MLTSQDIEMLFEALDAWETEATSNSMLGSLFAMALSKDDGKVMAEDILTEGRDKTRTRKEQSILLKAKLLQMRDEAVAQDVSDYLRK
jgi:hypothetical protein